MMRTSRIVMAVALAVGTLCAGEARKLWDGVENNAKLTGRMQETSLSVENGEFLIQGVNKNDGYSYISFTIPVEPFVIGDDQCIRVDFRTENHQEGDSLYVKAMSKSRKNVLSFMTYNIGAKTRQYLCIPGVTVRDGMKWFADDIREAIDEPITTLQFFFGRRKGDLGLLKAHLGNILLQDQPPFPKRAECVDLGVGISSAELRNYTAFLDAKGHPFVLSMLLDNGRPYVLLTDAMTGENHQYYVPEGIRGSVFGGVLTDEGKFVWGLSKIVIFDVNTREFEVSGPAPGSTLCAHVGKDGTVYLGSAPQARLVSVNPKTGEYHNYGRMDDQEDYVSHIAEDQEGYVYCGIGTARGNIVAFNPKTGQRTSIVPESIRALGTAHVFRGTDGYVYGTFKRFAAKMLGGKVVEENARSSGRAPDRSVHYGTRHSDFGNGMRVAQYDLNERFMVIKYQDGSTKRFAVDYVSGGLDITSMARGPENDVYYSSAHPHHLGRILPAEDKVVNLGYNSIVSGGNFCNMAAANGKLYAGEYAGGRMWEYDPAKPYAIGNRAANKLNFGVEFQKIVASSEVTNGHWTILNEGLLFAYGDNKENRFKVTLDVPGPGSYYLNLRFYKYGSYGTVTVKAGGSETRYNVQDSNNGPGPIVNLGPFQVDGKEFPVEFSSSTNDNKLSSHFFSLLGIELSREARKEVKADAGDECKDNPRILGRWTNLVTRPRTVAIHPSGEYVVIGGFANYGLTGGGLGVHNLKTGENSEVANEQMVPNESCICMEFMPDGNLVGGTSMDAPGGGHLKAEYGSVFVLDWNARKVVRHVQITGARHVICITYWNGLVFAGASDGNMYVVDPKSMSVLDKFNVAFGGNMIRNGFQKSPDGKELYLIMNSMIFRINPETRAPEEYLAPSTTISGGGPIIGDKLFAILRGVNVGYVKLVK